MIWTGKQYMDLMTFKGQPRQFFAELFGPLIGLPEEWRAQGASEGEIELTAFMFDGVDMVSAGAHTGYLHPMEEVVLEDTPGQRIVRDSMGRTSKLRKGFATISLPMDWPVKTMADWTSTRGIPQGWTWRRPRKPQKRAPTARWWASGCRAGMPRCAI